jgi:DNA-binding response OmpR family regulator
MHDCLETRRKGYIFIAGSDNNFLLSASPLLKERGFACDCESDITQAVSRLENTVYDLMVADSDMILDDRLVERIQKHPWGLPVILTLDRPILEVAVLTAKLNIITFLVRPFDMNEFLEHVVLGIRRSSFLKELSHCRDRVDLFEESIIQLTKIVAELPAEQSYVPIEAFVMLTTQNLIDSAMDLRNIIARSDEIARSHVCQLYRCPRMDMMKRSIKESIEVLEQTKKSFKSKELAYLRKRLQDLLTQL